MEHSAILSTVIKLPFAIEIFVLSIYDSQKDQNLFSIIAYRLSVKSIAGNILQYFRPS